MKRFQFISGVLLAAGAAGCTTVGPDYEPPATAVPLAWQEAGDSAYAAREPELDGWWRRFDDPVLDALIERAARRNLDLREALARVDEARALRGVAAADFWPRVDVAASYQRTQDSETTAFGQFRAIRASDQFTAGFDASWEIDLWGRIRRSVEAADADLGAGIEETRDVLVTMLAETAMSYVDLRAFQRRLDIARTNVRLQEQTLELVRSRFDAGLVGERDVAQAAGNLAATRSRIPSFDIGQRTAENRLAVLLGIPPGALADELSATVPIPPVPPGVAVGVPADLLRRRADIRRAERALAAETARIGVAEAELYPRLELFGSLGLQAENAGDLFTGKSATFGLGPSIRWNIFDFGRLRRQVDAQDARREQALAAWERAVLLALEEAENAMTGFIREQIRRRSLAESAGHARRAVELARTQYTEGLSDFQTVVDSERELALREDDLAISDAAIATRLIALYKALGGGWESAGPLPADA